MTRKDKILWTFSLTWLAVITASGFMSGYALAEMLLVSGIVFVIGAIA